MIDDYFNNELVSINSIYTIIFNNVFPYIW